MTEHADGGFYRGGFSGVVHTIYLKSYFQRCSNRINNDCINVLISNKIKKGAVKEEIVRKALEAQNM